MISKKIKENCLIVASCIIFLPVAVKADVTTTLNWISDNSVADTNISQKETSPYSASASGKGNPHSTCQDILEENDLSPDDIVWIAINPGDQKVPINAQQACETCYVGNGQPSWVCEPYDPGTDGGNGGTGSGSGGGDSGGTGSGFGGGDPGEVITITPEIDVVTKVGFEVENNTHLGFSKLSYRDTDKLFLDWFLPRNVDAQPRAFTDYSVNLFYGLIRSECSVLNNNSSAWVSGSYSKSGENEDRRIWNNYDANSSGLEAGFCFDTEGDNKYGFMLHLGRTSLTHEYPTSGNYDSDNFGGGVYYIDQNEANRITINLMMSIHDGIQKRYHNATYSGYQTTTQGDRDATSATFNVSYEGTDIEASFKPFALLSLNYVHQGGFAEKGFPLYSLEFDSRDTWWLAMEGGLKWKKVYETSQTIDYHLQIAGALTFLSNISDEAQHFTYDWGRTMAIAGSGDQEYGAALHFGVKRKPKNPNKMRVELSGTTGYQSELFTYSTLLNFTFPFEE